MMFDFLEDWRQARNVRQLPEARREMVFYSEGAAYWSHLEPIIRNLLSRHDQAVTYITSEARDPGLRMRHPLWQAFLIRPGTALTLLFRQLEARVMVMTMPDLDNFHLRRSIHRVHYVFVQHGTCSLHMANTKGAFDHYDTVFCTGPHQVRELRRMEEIYDLPRKAVFKHGFGRLDALLAAAANAPSRDPDAPPQVLVAPSWGAQGILETCGEPLLTALEEAGYRVTVRPHPETRRRHPRLLRLLERRWKSSPRVRFDTGNGGFDSLLAADVMISDWSSVAHEFAFGLEKPVLFIDVPRKEHNPDYREIGVEPVEIGLRETLGRVLAPGRIAEAPAQIDALLAEREAWRARVSRLRRSFFFNPGRSGEAGAAKLVSILEECMRALPDLREAPRFSRAER